MTDALSLLLMATLAKDDAAGHAWHRWRGQVDLETAPWQLLQVLPLLNRPRLQRWLDGDPDAGRLNGAVRRAWTESQIQLAEALDTAASVERTGTTVALVGAAAMHLHLGNAGPIRSIPQIQLLVPRAGVPTALQRLQAEGWVLQGNAPGPRDFDWSTNISLRRNNLSLRLYWRLFDVEARLAKACERDLLSTLREVKVRGTSVRLPVLRHQLLAAVQGVAWDSIPWQADAGLLAAAVTDWKAWIALAHRFAPRAAQRIAELRGFGADIPSMPPPRQPSVFRQRLANAIRWRSRRVKRSLRRAFHLPEDRA